MNKKSVFIYDQFSSYGAPYIENYLTKFYPDDIRVVITYSRKVFLKEKDNFDLVIIHANNLVDEFKTTKEAMFHLQQGKLVNEVQSKGFVDHAIAALLIAKRGIKGEVIKIEKRPLKQLFDYVVENYQP